MKYLDIIMKIGQNFKNDSYFTKNLCYTSSECTSEQSMKIQHVFHHTDRNGLPQGDRHACLNHSAKTLSITLTQTSHCTQPLSTNVPTSITFTDRTVSGENKALCPK